MYSRRLKDETLAFGHEGLLYKRSFVMYDRSTRSLWLHVSGEAIQGERKGQKLTFLPSVITTWAEWKARYPLTTVLEGRKAGGFMGNYDLKGGFERYGLSVGQGHRVRLYRYEDLKRSSVVHDTFDGKPIVVVFDAKTSVARAYASGGRRFVLKDGVLTDDQGVGWDWFTGVSLGADATGSLEPIPATVWLIDRWKAHNEKGEIYASR